MSLRRRLLRLYTALGARYGPQDWWPARSRFEVAVGAVLTQHTAWTGVARAIGNLRAARRLGPRRLRQLSLPRLGRLIRPAGTWRLKARRLRALAVFFLERAGGRLDRLRGAPLEALRVQLLAVPGVGPETADAILLYALDRPVFVADAYTRRVLSRHRMVPADIGYEALRRYLETHLPGDSALFNELHALLVAVAKSHCRARPRCEGCPLRFDLRGRRPRG
ncbi:MAG TPA: endonuclease III domain-containing protein [Methylomirabilota bacterium]